MAEVRRLQRLDLHSLLLQAGLASLRSWRRLQRVLPHHRLDRPLRLLRRLQHRQKAGKGFRTPTLHLSLHAYPKHRIIPYHLDPRTTATPLRQQQRAKSELVNRHRQTARRVQAARQRQLTLERKTRTKQKSLRGRRRNFLRLRAARVQPQQRRLLPQVALRRSSRRRHHQSPSPAPPSFQLYLLLYLLEYPHRQVSHFHRA